MNKPNHKQILYPPGGILIWIIIILELITFCAGIGAFAWQRKASLYIFDTAQESLNTNIGLINTLLLLTSGYFVAEAVRLIKLDKTHKSMQFILIAISLGLGFLILKSYEYFEKVQHGFDLTFNTFYTFYWLLTGFHYMHVMVGLVILIALALKIKKGRYHANKYLDVETGAAFWHMCDLIWLLLFPVLYLL